MWLARKLFKKLRQTQAAIRIQHQVRQWLKSNRSHAKCKTEISQLKLRISKLENTVELFKAEKEGHEKALRYLFQKVEELIMNNQNG